MIPGRLGEREVCPRAVGATDRDHRLLDGADLEDGGARGNPGERPFCHRVAQDGVAANSISGKVQTYFQNYFNPYEVTHGNVG